DEIRLRLYETTYGENFEWDDNWLRPLSAWRWLHFILDDLLDCSLGFEAVASIFELKLLLWPAKIEWYRDLGIALGKAGRGALAVPCLAYYLETNPKDRNKKELTELLRMLEKSKLPAR
ncbi:MAG: tetratricopeptide repeat protein, partial [bacterium]|nr:tetratricopeptide repeat protein [bacterium]